MGINLGKGERINLSKEAPSLKKVGVGLGWDTNASDTGVDFDLDASVFMSRRREQSQIAALHIKRDDG